MELDKTLAEQLRESESTEVPVTEESPVINETLPEEVDVKETVCTDENLKAIEDELKSLRDDIGKLETEFSENGNKSLCDILTRIDKLEEDIRLPQEKPEDDVKMSALLDSIKDVLDKNSRKLERVLEYNNDFQVSVREKMGSELQKLKKEREIEQNAPVLKGVASIYLDNLSLFNKDDSLSEKTKKNVDSLFEDFETFFEENGCEIIRSAVGSVRQTRVSTIIKKIPTGDESLHNTVVESLRPGIVLNRVVLIPEYVNVYVYDPSLKKDVSEEEENQTEKENVIPSSEDGEDKSDKEENNIEEVKGGNE